MPYKCNLCVGYSAMNFPVLLNHLGRCHRSDQCFHILCGIDGCSRTYRSYNAFRNHIKKNHKEILNADGCNQDNENCEELENPPAVVDDINMEIDEGCGHLQFGALCEEDSMRRVNALSMMKIREEGKLTQKSLNIVVDTSTEIVRRTTCMIKTGVDNSLKAVGVDMSTVPGLNELFNEDSLANNPFKGIATESEQCQYYREHFKLVEPKCTVLGERHVQARRGSKMKSVRKTDQVCYVPFLESLEQLLNNDSVMFDVKHPHKSTGNLLCDYCDGDDFVNHPLFSQDPYALQILLYFDEVEICNPLGSKANKHKLGAFYYTLGNIRPEKRSHLNAIQLLALVPSPHLKTYGPDDVLAPFMEDLSLLEQDDGYEFSINGNSVVQLRFSLVITLGLSFLVGLKKDHKPTGDAGSAWVFHEKGFILRTRGSYDQQCAHILRDDYYSYAYEINRSSPLNSSRYFHVIGGLPGDAMHDVLEGVLQYEVKELLNELINVKKLLTLKELNRRLAEFDYGYYNDANKPSPINEKRLSSPDHSLKQHAAQMWCLARFLPMLLGTLVPDDDEHWILFGKLLTITYTVFSTCISINQAAYLQVLIDEHHRGFARLYPGRAIIPKMHYMIHIPRTIIRLGLLVRSWCMRYEAKHSYFKQLALIIRNFTNMPLTLAKRHQHLICYRLQDECSGLSTFMDKGVDTGPGKTIYAGDSEHFRILQQGDASIKQDTRITESRWVTVGGTKYKVGCYLQTEVEDDELSFVLVNKIIVFSHNLKEVNFIVSKLETTGWNDHFQAYEVELDASRNMSIVKHSQLSYVIPLHNSKPLGLQSRTIYLAPRYVVAE
ncbi:uncharacterized protein LOC114531867 [Dendronephthya gigantea]|uniref:uncharacterized protein LOC114531867 n=1 Tax=Dendronephthya gigantea TaxID=151771 RepID=UPI00106BE669|nr:uncharacterized protein LOC114531867 [Dendronephthya gigantea]